MRLAHIFLGSALWWVALTLPPNAAQAAPSDWKPVDPADLALATPRVEKDADAEAIFWEVSITDEFSGRPTACSATTSG